MRSLSKVAAVVGAALLMVAGVSSSTPTAEVASAAATANRDVVIKTAYLTGYSWFDNTPPGSSAIAFPNAQHKVAGGTGRYTNPITLAVGWSNATGQEVPDYAPGTMFYLPYLHVYMRVEDECGDEPKPQNKPCHRLDTPGNKADRGATFWIDVWVDGKGYTRKQSDNCMSTISKIHTVVLNPSSTYPVHPASITGSCKAKRFFSETPAGQ